jgi:Mg-chelatase subunit ChlD
VARSQRSTVARRDLARHPRFEELSPEVGKLDETAVDAAMGEDPDQVLGLLADMSRATDPALRALARRLAGRLVVDVARCGPTRQRGVGRIETTPFAPDAGDLDLDASTEAIVEARAAGAALDPERLQVRRWVRPRTALCLLVDRSGSMQGRPLATSAVAAAAAALRCESQDYSVIAFAGDAVALKSQDAPAPVEQVVDRVLTLRGKGTTDLAGALRLAAGQLARSTAGRKVVVVLSDCRATEPGDVPAAAAALDELVVVAPAGDDDDARRLAQEVGAPIAVVAGPSEVPAAFAELLG